MTAIHNGTALLKQEDLNSEALIVILCYPHTLKLFPQCSIAHKITLPGTCFCTYCYFAIANLVGRITKEAPKYNRYYIIWL